MVERAPRTGPLQRYRAGEGLPAFEADSSGDLLIGLGNSLRGDDGAGPALAAWAQRRWPDLRVRSVQQLTPELSCELASAGRVLFVDAWCGLQAPVTQGASAQDFGAHPAAEPAAPEGPGRTADGPSTPVLMHLWPASAAGAASAEAGAFSHRLDPAQLLAITALLHGRAPQSWMLLVPAFRFEHGTGLSAGLKAQLPAAEALLRQWCDSHA